jgi:mRNA-degrading endonuclease RelE of RelBE toxin-antitoxin system
MYTPGVRESVDRIFHKLVKKDPKQMLAAGKKIEQILTDSHHFRPLWALMQHLRRVHVGIFVLVYSIDEKNKMVTMKDYAYHDEVYLGR